MTRVRDAGICESDLLWKIVTFGDDVMRIDSFGDVVTMICAMQRHIVAGTGALMMAARALHATRVVGE